MKILQSGNIRLHAFVTTTAYYCSWQCRCLAFQYPVPIPPIVRVARTALYSTSAALDNVSSSDDHQQIDPLVVKQLTSFAQELASTASHTIMPYWRQSDVEVETKKDETGTRSISQTLSPVTIADRSAELAMRKLIESKFPTHGIYGEEYGQVRTDADFVWVLDPIDGTKAFITGKPTWGTLIGCLYQGVPIVGIIDHCILKERWVGSVGNPTILNGQSVSTTKSATSLSNATIYTTTPDMFRTGEEVTKFNTIRDASLRTLYGCDCYAYALVASGFGADAVIEADLGLYDYAAIVPVMEGAGGIITDWNGNKLTLQNHINSKGRVVASSNNMLHSEMLRTLSLSTAAETTEQPDKERQPVRLYSNKRSSSIIRYALTLIAGILMGKIRKS